MRNERSPSITHETSQTDINDVPKVYVLLPVHNRREITVNFVDRLKKQTYGNYHLILIDDGSTDGTSEAVRDILENVTILRGKGNWWWAGSLHQAYKWLLRNNASSDDYILVMNDDTEFNRDFISAGISIIREYPRTLLTATGYNLKTGEPRDSGGYRFVWENLGCLETYNNEEMNCLSTRGMLARVSDFIYLKGFYPRLIPHYLSDIEFTMRAHKRGMKLMIHKDFRIYIDFEETGFREFRDETFMQYMRKQFSKRSAMNPVYWSNFILLHSPWKLKMSNLKLLWSSIYKQAIVDRLLPEIRSRIDGMK